MRNRHGSRRCATPRAARLADRPLRARNHIKGLERLGCKATIHAIKPDTRELAAS
jgi:hypothetical protein